MPLKEIAQKILNREIKDNEGVDILDIDNIENTLKISLPTGLKEFYLVLGNNKLFTEGHQRFVDLNELVINRNILVFLEENQCACYWGVDLTDTKTIYQSSDISFKECYAEEFNLNQFIEMMLYFQCVMASDNLHEITASGFKYFASLDINECKEIEKELLQELKINFKNELTGNGVSVFCNPDTIFLTFLDKYGRIDQLFTCCRDETYFESLIEKYYFMEL